MDITYIIIIYTMFLGLILLWGIYLIRKPKIRKVITNINSDKKPNMGQKVRITWLPNPRNHPNEKNCYIGMEGEVNYHFENGEGFGISSGLSVLEKPYKYKILDNLSE